MLTQCFIQVSTSGLSNVEHGLLYELMKCVTTLSTRHKLDNNGIVGENVVHQLGSLESCWKTAFRVCREYRHRWTDGYYMYVNRNHLCGGLNSGTSLWPLAHDFRVYSAYGMLIEFLKFNLPCSTLCMKAHLAISPNGNHQNRLIYCGK